MYSTEIKARIAHIERIPKHLREFEENCELRSLRFRLRAQLNAERDAALLARQNKARTALIDLILTRAKELKARGLTDEQIADHPLVAAVSELYCASVEKKLTF
jgi:hypothetical protein